MDIRRRAVDILRWVAGGLAGIGLLLIANNIDYTLVGAFAILAVVLLASSLIVAGAEA